MDENNTQPVSQPVAPQEPETTQPSEAPQAPEVAQPAEATPAELKTE